MTKQTVTNHYLSNYDANHINFNSYDLLT